MRPRIRRLLFVPLAALLCLTLSSCVVTRYSFDGKADAKQSITVWTYINDPVLTPALAAIWKKKHPDVEVRNAFIDLNELPPKLVAASATGEGPDVIIGNPVVDYPLVQAGGAYADITDRVEQSDVEAHYPSSGLWKTDGRIHALQWRFNNLGLYYNQDLLDKYGLTPPHTVAEMEHDMAVAHQKSGGKVRGIAMSADATVQSAWQMMTWMLGDGVNYCNLDSPQAEKTLARLKSWKDKGYTGPALAAQGMEDVYADFLGGDFLFAEGGNWEVGLINASPPKFKVGTATIPRGLAGSYTSFAGESVALGAHSTQKDLAWDYIKSVYLSTEGQTTTFTASGALPPRLDVRDSKTVQKQKLSQPFLEQLGPGRLKPWPKNTHTLDAQNDVGTSWSDLMAGTTTPKQAAAAMRDKVRTAFKEGQGGC